MHDKLNSKYIKNVIMIFLLVWRSGRGFFLANFFFVIVEGSTPILLIYLTSRLFDMLQNEYLDRSNSLPKEFVLLLLMLVAANIFVNFLLNAQTSMRSLYGIHFSNYIQGLIAEKAAFLDLENFDDPGFNNTFQVVVDEAYHKPVILMETLSSIAATTITLISLSVTIVLWHPWMLLVVLAVSLLTLQVSLKFGGERVNLEDRRASLERHKSYLFSLLVNSKNAKDLRLFSLQKFFLNKLKMLQLKTFRQDKQLAIKEMVVTGFANLISGISQGALMIYIALQAVAGTISIGQFNLYYSSASAVQDQLTFLMILLGRFHESVLFGTKVLEYLEMACSVETSPKYTQRIIPSAPYPPLIEFRNVSFKYPSTERKVLENVSFKIQPNEVVAILGKNGAGKSSLFNLITGFYAPSSGQILIDGIDIQTIDRGSLRKMFSMVLQSYNVYESSLAENIRIGDLENESVNAVVDAARQSGLNSIMEQLPNGYETIMGRSWDNGHELSGGQKQKLAIARSLFRNSPVLILDEPAASLDFHAETDLFDHRIFSHSNRGSKTVIFTSHNLSIACRADRIIIFESGKLVEQGSHNALINHGGKYADMFHQFQSLSNEADQ